jgi:PhnB protein
MYLRPYLFFTGNALEAMTWYHSIFGGTMDTLPNQDGNGLMHADLKGGLVEFMGSDGTRTTPYETSQISMSLHGNDAEVITAVFHKLAEGGTVTQDLQTESWGDTFGQLTDKFGIDWMVNIAAQ